MGTQVGFTLCNYNSNKILPCYRGSDGSNCRPGSFNNFKNQIIGRNRERTESNTSAATDNGLVTTETKAPEKSLINGGVCNRQQVSVIRIPEVVNVPGCWVGSCSRVVWRPYS